MVKVRRDGFAYKLIGFALICFVFSLRLTMTVHAKTYYSYKNVGLDYSTRKYGFMDFYSEGKKGYNYVSITSITDSKVKYKKVKFRYDPDLGHYGAYTYGKTYTAKLTKTTKYYACAKWQRLNKLKVYNYKYGSKKFKNLKVLKKVNRKQFFAPYFVKNCFIKVKKGKAVSIVHPVVLADI